MKGVLGERRLLVTSCKLIFVQILESLINFHASPDASAHSNLIYHGVFLEANFSSIMKV